MLTNILTDIIPGFAITYDTLLISIFGGLINGFVISLCLWMNATTGGTDFIAIYFSEKKGIDSFNIVLGMNAIILIAAGILFGWDKALYSIIYQYASTQVLHTLYKKYQHIKNVILTGFLFSLSIEIVQMFGWGATDINDLIINTAGACLGYLIYYLVSKILPINFRKRLQSENVNDMVEIMLYAIYIFIVMITVQPWVIHSLLNIG